MMKVIILLSIHLTVFGFFSLGDTLTTPRIIENYGYPVEIHHVITEDGYILELHRIPHGMNNNAEDTKGVVIVQHGLFCSSADWVITGPEKGLAFILADNGYDVWLGNSRGNDYSQKHTELNPNTSSKYWDFSWHEMGVYDLPAMVDHILAETEKPDLLYVAQSQGTTISFVGNIHNPGLRNKIKAIFNMAPIAYLWRSRNLLMQLISKTELLANAAIQLIGNQKFAAGEGLLGLANEVTCTDTIPPIICTNIAFLAGGYDETQFNRTIVPKLKPAAISTKQLLHYSQHFNKPYFRQYDYGPLENLAKYGSLEPPKYDLSKVTIPVYLYLGKNDKLADSDDVGCLIEQLGNLADVYTVPYDLFDHNDFLYAIDAKSLVYDKLIEDMDRVIAELV